MRIREKIKSKIKRTGGHALCLALEKGLINGHLDYEKFIILGMGRTGSNMLASSLRSHRKLVTYGELFNNAHGRILWEHPKYIPCRAHGLWQLRETEPLKFLEEFVFRPFSKKISAVGFKIFYYHAQEENWKCVWSYLKSMSNLKVIHIKRKNILNTLLSLKIAFKTNEWSNPKHGKSRARPAIKLEYNECIEAFQKTREYEKVYDNYFEKHEKMNVVYEDLTRNYSEEMKHIQKFIGIKHEVLQPYTKKQSKHTLSESISNYWSLKERFEGSPWAEFFTD